MVKDIEVSVINETTLLVKDFTIYQRLKDKNDKPVFSDLIYVDDNDRRKKIRFVTVGTTYTSYLRVQFRLLPEPGVDLADDSVKVYLLNNSGAKVGFFMEPIPLYVQIDNGSNTHNCNSHHCKYTHCNYHPITSDHINPVDNSVSFQVEFKDCYKFDRIKSIHPYLELFVINKVVNQDFYDTQVGLDFTFVVGNKNIKALKYLMRMCSQVFQAMLDKVWKDSLENQIEIEDIEYDVMDTFVRAMHGVEMKIRDIAMAIKLAIVADKYDVQPLKEQAANYVKYAFDEKSVIDALTLGHQLGLIEIQQNALDYIVKFDKPFSGLVNHNQASKEVTQLIVEALHTLKLSKPQKSVSTSATKGGPLKEQFVMNKVTNQSFYENNRDSFDFTLTMNNSEIKASKFLLRMNSEVFDKVISEAAENHVEVNDVEYEVMDTFIRAMHGVEMKIKDIAMAIKLAIVADKYKVEQLKEQAAQYVDIGLVKNGVDERNVIEMLTLSHQLGLVDVKDKALAYFVNYRKQLSELVGYDQASKEVLHLMFEALHKHKIKK